MAVSWWRRSAGLAIASLAAVSIAVSVGGYLRGGGHPPSEFPDFLRRELALRYPDQASPLPRGIETETYVGGLELPTSIAWVPGTPTMFVAEKNGAIRVIDRGRLLDAPCTTLPVTGTGSAGLLEVEVSPSFEEDRTIFVYYTAREPVENRVARITVDDDLTCGTPEPLLTGIPADQPEALDHNGGRLVLQDGFLFISTGDTQDSQRAQDVEDLAGKVLRIESDGDVPADNPHDSPVWAHGFRNPFGLAAGPQGEIWLTDNGPDCSDELNLVAEGRNFGWGYEGLSKDAACVSYEGTDLAEPAVRWNPNIGVTDLIWYEGDHEPFQGLVVVDFVFGFIHRVELTADGTDVGAEDVYEVPGNVGLIDVEEGPQGDLFLAGVERTGSPEGVILRVSAAE